MYYVYILKNRNVLYTGMTNNMNQLIAQHRTTSIAKSTFVGRYKCHHLVYYEIHQTPMDAIRRKKTIKGKSRKWKLDLMESFNPEWNFLENEALPYTRRLFASLHYALSDYPAPYSERSYHVDRYF